VTSGIRIGTPALTTRGMGKKDMIFIANLIDKVIMNVDDDFIMKEVKEQIFDLCKQYPIYKD